MAKMPTIENMIDKALQNYVYPHINIDTCFGTPVDGTKKFSINSERVDVGARKMMGFRGGSIPSQSVELKFDIDPDAINKMFGHDEGHVFGKCFNMATDYNYKEKAMAKRKYFKFKFITLEREDCVTVDGSEFHKNKNGLSGFCYLYNGTYHCTVKEEIDECDTRYYRSNFQSDYFFKEITPVAMIPTEFISDLK